MRRRESIIAQVSGAQVPSLLPFARELPPQIRRSPIMVSYPSVDRTQILERLRERIVRFAASRHQGDSAEDLAQEVLLVLHEKYPTLDRAEDLVPVSLEIARLKIWAARRKSARRGENAQVPVDELPLASADAGPLDLAERHQRTERLQAALSRLGDRCRELFRLKLEGHSFAEIQKLMDAASLNTLYTWDFRCRKQLLEELGGDWDAPGPQSGARNPGGDA